MSACRYSSMLNRNINANIGLERIVETRHWNENTISQPRSSKFLLTAKTPIQTSLSKRRRIKSSPEATGRIWSRT
ncbi:hypothetical protein AVEN_275612-1, partial [Araneus ventricosus]